MSGLAQPAFLTARLAVFSFRYLHRLRDMERTMFVGTFREEDWPGPAVAACVWPEAGHSVGGPEGSAYLDWIETATAHRREGLARELWRAIEIHLGCELIGDGVSDEGEALCESMASPPGGR